MKPPGMTADFRITHADRWMDEVWEAVRSALESGITVEVFRRECAQAWQEERDIQTKYDREQWSKK